MRPATGDGNGVVERVVRVGPVVRLRVRLDDGRTLEAAVAALAHPRAGDRVDIEVDPEGIVRLPMIRRRVVVHGLRPGRLLSRLGASSRRQRRRERLGA